MKTKTPGRKPSNPIEHFAKPKLIKDMPFATLVASQKCQLLKKRSLYREDDITITFRILYTLCSSQLRLVGSVPKSYDDKVDVYNRRQRAIIVACCSILVKKLVNIADVYIDWQDDIDLGKDEELPF